jgi:hypothetical protein
MRVTLVWLDEAESTLATAFMAAKQHGLADEFSLAIHRGEQEMRSAPLTAGESRGGRQRFLIARPAGLLYEWHEPEGVLVVLMAHFIAPRRT